MLRKLTAVLMLVLISTACASREGEVTDLGIVAQILGEAARAGVAEGPGGENAQLRATSTTPVATIAADSLVFTLPGKLPKKADLLAKKSNFRAPGDSDAEGWMAIVVAGTADDLGVLRQPPVKTFNKLQVIVNGDKQQANYDEDLFGAFVCGSEKSAPNNMTAKFKVKGAQQAPIGTAAVYAFVRVQLALLGLTPAEWEEACNSTTDLLPMLRGVSAAQSGLELTR